MIVWSLKFTNKFKYKNFNKKNLVKDQAKKQKYSIKI